MSEIISFAEAKKKLESRNSLSSVEEQPISFAEAMRKNMENKNRLQKDRLKANKSVLKSYRIKPEKK